MTGSRESVIGFSKEDFLRLLLGRKASPIKAAGGPAEINAVAIQVDVEGRQAISIERVCGENALGADFES